MKTNFPHHVLHKKIVNEISRLSTKMEMITAVGNMHTGFSTPCHFLTLMTSVPKG